MGDSCYVPVGVASRDRSCLTSSMSHDPLAHADTIHRLITDHVYKLKSITDHFSKKTDHI
jgi:hypothetical protein